jgi:subtilisin family serine protease
MPVALLLLVLLALLALPAAAAGASPAERYIVVLDDGRAGAVADAHARRFDADIGFVYRHALSGYSARVPRTRLDELRSAPAVAYVERDRRVEAFTTQTDPPWGLDRIDQRSRPLNNRFTYSNTGQGVEAYIIDTGIRFSHGQFGGRAVNGHDAVDGGPAQDCHGHGTHVAGTVGGSTYGVAKQVTLVAVRVLDCDGSGPTSGVIEGVDWVTGDHVPGQPAVANVSLGGPRSSALDTAVRSSIADGVGYAVAAGNGNIFGRAGNACNFSPSRVGGAMTISATNRKDRKISWANYGRCVDWFGPGAGITSAWFGSDSDTETISGTSMATPHTTGVAALYLEDHPGASPRSVRTALFQKTTKNIVGSSRTANNHLLFTDW